MRTPQTRRRTSRASTVAEIEGREASWTSASVPPGRETTFGASISGGQFEVPEQRQCVEVERDPALGLDGERTVSGERLLASGDFEGRWRSDWRTGERAIFVPLHQPEVGVDRRRRSSSRRCSSTIRRHTYSYTETGDVYAPVPGDGTEAGYVTGFMLPRAGRWAVVATDGENWDWGCFVLEVG